MYNFNFIQLIKLLYIITESSMFCLIELKKSKSTGEIIFLLLFIRKYKNRIFKIVMNLYRIKSKIDLSLLKFYKPSSADRKSTRLNSSHVAISYAVFCLKKKTDIK